MATLWETITSNSSLAVQSGNTFWDHLNNQKVFGPGKDVYIKEFSVLVDDDTVNVTVDGDSDIIIGD